nr:MAG TPA: hypothetical protein [Bacteriophage sp.]
MNRKIELTLHNGACCYKVNSINRDLYLLQLNPYAPRLNCSYFLIAKVR